MYWCRRILKTTILVAALMTSTAVRAQVNDEAVSALRAVNDFEWSQMSFRVVDQDGRPITGAIVRPWALRWGGWWSPEAYGSPPRVTTDVKGIATIDFPKNSRLRGRRPIDEISFFISHEDFCTENADVRLFPEGAPNLPSVKLQRGVKLRIAGVAPGSDQPLSHCHVILEGSDGDEPEFTARPDGWLDSIPIQKDRRWFRVVRLVPGELPQFSLPRTWTMEKNEPIEMKVEVYPGVKVLGRISDLVPRPINRGRVVVWCGSPKQQLTAIDQNRSSPIWWRETVSIRNDGTFEFPSLPAGYLAQFFAIADDYVSSQPTDDAYEKCVNWFNETERGRHLSFRYGQVLRLVGKQQNLVLDMEQAGRVQVKCVDQQGHPLNGIKVASWPNQYIVGAGATIFCEFRSSVNQLRGWDWFRSRDSNPYQVLTNANGEATLLSMPKGQRGLVTDDPFWKCQADLNVNVTAGKTETVLLELERTQ